MMKKRNFFKTLSSAVLVTLTVGNFSTVWMMEETFSIVDEMYKYDLVSKFEASIKDVLLSNKLTPDQILSLQDSTIEFSKTFASAVMSGFPKDTMTNDLVDFIVANAVKIYEKKYLKEDSFPTANQLKSWATNMIKILQLAERVYQKLKKDLSNAEKKKSVRDLVRVVFHSLNTTINSSSKLHKSITPRELFDNEDTVVNCIVVCIQKLWVESPALADLTDESTKKCIVETVSSEIQKALRS